MCFAFNCSDYILEQTLASCVIFMDLVLWIFMDLVGEGALT